MSNELNDLLGWIYNSLEGSDDAEAYAARHGVESIAVLTNYDDEHAGLVAEYLADRIRGRVVVEIGGGIGLLAFHMGQYASRVYVIEAAPAWSWAFAHMLYDRKPKNVSYLFGAADEFVGMVRADVALFCTHSGVSSMRAAASLFAPVVIDVYGELAPDAIARLDATLGLNGRELTRQNLTNTGNEVPS